MRISLRGFISAQKKLENDTSDICAISSDIFGYGPMNNFYIFFKINQNAHHFIQKKIR